MFLDLHTIVTLQNFLLIRIWFLTANITDTQNGCDTLLGLYRTSVILEQSWRTTGLEWGRTEVEQKYSMCANLCWLQCQETNTNGGETVKVIQRVEFIAESPWGIWMQMWGVSQSLLVTNGGIWWELSARTGKGNQRMKSEKNIIRSATMCQYSSTFTTKKSSTRLANPQSSAGYYKSWQATW